MQEHLGSLKVWSISALKRSDFVWHNLLQSFSTWGDTRRHAGLIENQDNHGRVTFDALCALDVDERPIVLLEVFRAAKIRYAETKARLMVRNYDLMAKMGGPVAAKKQALAQDEKEAKITTMERFHGIGPKYARNILMDAYHSDFHNTITVDLGIKKITKALDYSFKTFEEQERFYQEIAEGAGLQGWELNRLLYNYTDYFQLPLLPVRVKAPPQASDLSRASGTTKPRPETLLIYSCDPCYASSRGNLGDEER